MFKKTLVTMMCGIIAISSIGFANQPNISTNNLFNSNKNVKLIRLNKSVTVDRQTKNFIGKNSLENSIVKFSESLADNGINYVPTFDATKLEKHSNESNSFSVDSNKQNADKKFELVSPKINANQDVAYEDELLISLKVPSKFDATLTVTRMNDPRWSILSETQQKKLDKMANSAPSFVDVNVYDASNPDFDEIVESTFDENDISDDFDELTNQYERAGKSLILSYYNYNRAFSSAIKNNPDLTSLQLFSIVRQRQLIKNGFSDLHTARQLYEVAAEFYLSVKQKYDSFAGKRVIDEMPIVLDGALPYFNTSLRKPPVGRYELEVRSSKTGEILGDKIEFYIVNKNKLSEDFYNTVKKQMNDMLGTY